MENVGQFLSAAAVTLFASQSIVIVARLRSCAHRVEPLLLTGSLLAMAVLAAVPGAILEEHPAAWAAVVAAAVWSGGAFLFHIRGKGRSLVWAAASGIFLAVLLAVDLLGFGRTVSFQYFRAFGACGLSLCPLVLLSAEGLESRSLPLLASLGLSVVWIGVFAVHAASGRPSLGGLDLQTLFLLLLSACTGWLVLKQGYPFQGGWREHLRALEDRDRLVRGVYKRLLAAESALVLKDRLIAAGLLAMGAAHEFKGALGAIKTSAEHGLAADTAEVMADSLRLICESAEAGRQSAVLLLERLSAEGREKASPMDADRDLAGFLRMARASCRQEGAVISCDLAHGVRFVARRSEVEQILLNLIRNAVDSFREKGLGGRPEIALAARQTDGHAIIEVSDNAGGIEAESAHRLFEIAFSRNGSTGVGLFISRSLAMGNGGSLEYVPIEGGSCFRLVFAAVER